MRLPLFPVARGLATLVGCLLIPAVVSAAPFPVVITDPYAGPLSKASSNGDVIGATGGFDIESVTISDVTPREVTVHVEFNYNFGEATLAPYRIYGVTMEVGDLLFGVNGAYKYGVALVEHDGFEAGDLYSIAGTRDSNSYLAGSGLIWRYLTAVRMNPQGATHLGDGDVSVTSLGGSELDAAITFRPAGDFLVDLEAMGLSVHFASAICANDVIDGLIEPTRVPVPASFVLLAGGLLVTAAARRWRKPLRLSLK